jgi:hypothetical protein
LLKNAHLRRWAPTTTLRRTGLYDSLLGISGALYLSVFEQPASRTFSESCYFFILRNASMKGSNPPSITLSRLPTSTLVRWSLTSL